MRVSLSLEDIARLWRGAPMLGAKAPDGTGAADGLRQQQNLRATPLYLRTLYLAAQNR